MQPKKEHYRGKLPHFQQPGQWYMVTCILKDAIPKGALQKYSIQLEAARNRMKELENRISRESESPESEFPNSDRKNRNLGKSQYRELQTRLETAKKEYQIALRKYRMAYEKALNATAFKGINLVKDENRKLIEEALLHWENKRLTNHAWCIMPNHFHWIFTVFETEGEVGGVPGAVVSNSDTDKRQYFSSTLESRSPRESRDTEFPNSVRENHNLGKSESREFEFPNSTINKAVYLQDILHSVKLFTARRINQNENRSGQLWEHESFETTIRDNRHFANAMKYVLNNPVKAGFVQDWKNWPGSRSFTGVGVSGSRSFHPGVGVS